MEKVRLSTFDFFAYISGGLAIMLAVSAAFTRLWGTGATVTIPDLSATQAVFLLAIAYIAGHVVACLAGVTMDQILAKQLLERPSVWLFRKPLVVPHGSTERAAIRAAERAALRHDFPNANRLQRLARALVRALDAAGWTSYGQRIDARSRALMLDRLRADGASITMADPYWAVMPAIYAAPGDTESRTARVERFYQLSQFARNLAAVAFAYCLMLSFTWLFGWTHSEPFGIGLGLQWLGGFALGVLLTLRYLKFFHLSTLEMFLIYSRTTT